MKLATSLVLGVTLALAGCADSDGPTGAGSSAVAQATWTPSQAKSGPGWQLLGISRAPDQAPTGISVAATSADGADVVLTVGPGGPGCQVPVFAGVVERSMNSFEAHIDRVFEPGVSHDHCLVTSRNTEFTVHLDSKPAPYDLELGDSVACTSTCGALRVVIDPAAAAGSPVVRSTTGLP